MENREPMTIPTLPARAVRRRDLLSLSGSAALAVLGCSWPHAARADADEAVLELQREWEIIKYRTPAAQRISRFETLAAKAHSTTDQYRDSSPVLIWEAVIVSSWAEAKALYEAALKIHMARYFEASGSARKPLGILASMR